MRIEIVYYEVKRKEFRKKKTFVEFMKNKQLGDIIQAAELQGKTRKLLIIHEQLYSVKWRE
jgi:alkylhydroperoxidase/carboxymuconolactone decarboxylase family protein YurZ